MQTFTCLLDICPQSKYRSWLINGFDAVIDVVICCGCVSVTFCEIVKNHSSESDSIR